MSKTLSSVAVTEFDSMVKQAYQGMGMLKPAVTQRNNVIGDTYKFRRMGKGLANQKSTSDLVTPMDVTHEFKTATLTNWNAPEYTDMFDAKDVNFDEKQELANTIAGALGRIRGTKICLETGFQIGSQRAQKEPEAFPFATKRSGGKTSEPNAEDHISTESS